MARGKLGHREPGWRLRLAARGELEVRQGEQLGPHPRLGWGLARPACGKHCLRLPPGAAHSCQQVPGAGNLKPSTNLPISEIQAPYQILPFIILLFSAGNDECFNPQPPAEDLEALPGSKPFLHH